ncbi:type 2 lanthipeptide synthetase LanM family protein [Kitasatospora brasiliensis]|uniref:type 2 lanthipeptide synthetase LanM family protein n=1 Tax=Kitasatospora brasiliensis TaxID=3058040 RepID=UPI00292DF99D|nr:type 2 lanthipeptide synthetase LanM family protein [Kitasatospora sp. K002]
MPSKTPPEVADPVLPWSCVNRAPLTGSWWARGLWLAERLAAGGEPGPVPDSPAEGSLGWRADRRLARWRTAYPDHTPDTASAQAHALGLDPERLRRLIAEHPDQLAARSAKPAWARFVEGVMARAPELPPAAPEREPQAGAHRHWFTDFAVIVEPFLAEARRLLGTDTHEAVQRSLDSSLREQLVALLGRALVLELHVARLSGQLAGDTPSERFHAFIARQRRPEQLAALLDEYAVLARLVAYATENAAHAHREFLRRFTADRPLLVERIFGGRDPGELTAVRMGGGDGHEAGRSVALLTFSSGARLVYKPRPLAVHEHFNAVVDWYDTALPGLDLGTVTAWDRGEYGWTQFVEPAPCADHAAAERFYHRLGALLALLYALAATDFHFENVIAAGEQPIAVDLESLFHVGVPLLTGSPLVDEDPAQHLLAHSVQRVGLLPSVLVGDGGAVLDVGGMGADKGAAMPFKSPAWEGDGTDEMRLTRVRLAFEGSANRPRLDGRDVDPADHLASLRAGFAAGYRAIAAHREELLAPDGPLSRFREDTSRTIVRATRVYAHLLSESTHPDVTRDALDRDRVLGLIFAQSAENPAIQPLLTLEAESLWSGDVPLFRSVVGSRELRTHSGRLLPQALPESGLDRSRRIIAAMGEQDLATQDWIIRAAFAARASNSPSGTPQTAEPTSTDSDRSPAERALALARSVADQLTADAHRTDGRAGWLGLDLNRDQWRVTALRDDLYGGYAGLALFFAQLAAITREERYAQWARRILAPFPEHLAAHRLRAAKRPWGAFGGLSGTAYALDCAAVLLDDPALAAPVPDLLEAAARDLDEDDRQLDLIGGSAGCLAVAEALAHRHGAVAHACARHCARLLIGKAESQPDGTAVWRTAMTAERPLLGMSHGTGGIGWALLRHAARTGDAAALRTGQAALAHEDAGFDPAIDNWPDFRELSPRPWQAAPPPGTTAHVHAWCHGAPGVGLLRADLPATTRTRASEQALLRAVRSTAAARTDGDSLCHGRLGNLELFAVAARAGVAEAREHYPRARDAVLAAIERRGPLCGTPGGIPTPGLMTGLAGIGHGLLRIAAPELIAPVLLLAPQEAR